MQYLIREDTTLLLISLYLSHTQFHFALSRFYSETYPLTHAPFISLSLSLSLTLTETDMHARKHIFYSFCTSVQFLKRSSF